MEKTKFWNRKKKVKKISVCFERKCQRKIFLGQLERIIYIDSLRHCINRIISGNEQGKTKIKDYQITFRMIQIMKIRKI